jgi:uncharacterized sporulation protein YeaH/YhbH (DUF444 family)
MNMEAECSYSHDDNAQQDEYEGQQGQHRNEDEGQQQGQHRNEDEGQHEEQNSEVEIDDSRRSSLQLSNSIKTSEVWQYFTKDINFKQNKKSTCNQCGAVYTCSGGSTSNLKKHIVKKHPKKLEPNQLTITDVFNVTAKVSIHAKSF